LKNNKIIYLFLVICSFSFKQHIAQNNSTNEQLAQQFFDQRDFEKANVYYEKLYDKNPINFYSNYLRCLIKIGDKKKAEKVIKKQLKLKPEALETYIDLGVFYASENEVKKSEEQFEKAIKELSSDYNQLINLVAAFRNAKLYDYAILTYERGAKLNNMAYPYYYEKAEVYKEKGDLKGMINEYLEALDFRESELQSVQTHLQNNLGYDDVNGGFNNPVLKQELQKRIQNDPSKIIFSEFLIFIQLQQKDFEGALIQSKALDKRLKEDGFRLMELGKICFSNEYFETAEKAYQYVLEKGRNTIHYATATIESALLKYEQLTKSTVMISNESIQNLTQKLNNVISEFGVNQTTIPILRKLAGLYAYYMNNPEEAILKLNQALETPGLEKNILAECKLELGDVTLISGNIWDASLLYSQVEKAFKYDLVGQEAKFRNAKLAYYNGDFKWSKAQLDVLKGATSKLIANDAMDLSLIIGDAINIDTNVVPLQYFASADLLLIQNKTDEALKRMDSINILFDNHSLADDIYFKKGVIFTKKGMYQEALESFKRVVENYGDEIFGDDAFFKMAELYQFQLQDIEKAKSIYQEMLTKYPGSVYTVEARKRFRKLRGDNIN